jgi:anti-sigma B factor antagonist
MDETVVIHRFHRVLIARCRGDLDLSSQQVLRAGLAPLLGCGRRGVQGVVLDLSAVSFLDCSALGELLAVARAGARDGVRVVLLGTTPIVRRLLVTLELDRVLPMTADPTQAREWAATITGPAIRLASVSRVDQVR